MSEISLNSELKTANELKILDHVPPENCAKLRNHAEGLKRPVIKSNNTMEVNQRDTKALYKNTDIDTTRNDWAEWAWSLNRKENDEVKCSEKKLQKMDNLLELGKDNPSKNKDSKEEIVTEDDIFEDCKENKSFNRRWAINALRYANLNFEQGNFEGAIERYTKAIEHDPTNFRYFINRSIAHEKLRMWKEALRDAERAALVHLKTYNSIRNPKIFCMLGKCFAHFKEYSKADQVFRQSIRISHDVEVHSAMRQNRLNFFREIGISDKTIEDHKWYAFCRSLSVAADTLTKFDIQSLKEQFEQVNLSNQDRNQETASMETISNVPDNAKKISQPISSPSILEYKNLKPFRKDMFMLSRAVKRRRNKKSLKSFEYNSVQNKLPSSAGNEGRNLEPASSNACGQIPIVACHEKPCSSRKKNKSRRQREAKRQKQKVRLIDLRYITQP